MEAVLAFYRSTIVVTVFVNVTVVDAVVKDHTVPFNSFLHASEPDLLIWTTILENLAFFIFECHLSWHCSQKQFLLSITSALESADDITVPGTSVMTLQLSCSLFTLRLYLNTNPQHAARGYMTVEPHATVLMTSQWANVRASDSVDDYWDGRAFSLRFFWTMLRNKILLKWNKLHSRGMWINDISNVCLHFSPLVCFCIVPFLHTRNGTLVQLSLLLLCFTCYDKICLVYRC